MPLFLTATTTVLFVRFLYTREGEKKTCAGEVDDYPLVYSSGNLRIRTEFDGTEEA